MIGNGLQLRKLACLSIVACLTACSGGGGPGGAVPQVGSTACSNDGQKQFVLDSLYDWYLWNDLLPANINIADYDSPEQLVFEVTTTLGPQDSADLPIDRFSSVGSLQADTEFFGEGKFDGFGFSWRFVDPAQTELRITRTFPGSPADLGGLERGQQVLTLNARSVADIVANEGISAFFAANAAVEFEVQPLAGPTLTSSIASAVVTIDPIPQWRVIAAGGGRNVGYMELTTFISTADVEFETVFEAFAAANVTEIIIDLRYNGGGLVNTAELLGDFLGGSVAQNLLFTSTEFNADRAAQNNRSRSFNILSNSISLSRLAIIATQSTASASELVTNGMIPHVDVAIVGDRTFGKPVGQIGLEFCDKILRPTAFKVANADGNGDYFDGLPVDCAAADDLAIPIGDDLDPNMMAAMTYFDTGACPAVTLVANTEKSATQSFASTQRRQDLDGRQAPSPQREFLGAE